MIAGNLCSSRRGEDADISVSKQRTKLINRRYVTLDHTICPTAVQLGKFTAEFIVLKYLYPFYPVHKNITLQKSIF